MTTEWGTDYTSLLDTLYELDKRDDGCEMFNTLNIIANLMWELGNKGTTSAVYNRTLRHGKLRIELNYKEMP